MHFAFAITLLSFTAQGSAFGPRSRGPWRGQHRGRPEAGFSEDWPHEAGQGQQESQVIPSEAYVEVKTDPAGLIWPWRVFKSDINTPPNMTITRSGAPLAPGFVFATPWPNDYRSVQQSAAYMMTDDNEMVFCVPRNGQHHFRVQQYNGKPHLTYWNGLNAPFPQVGKGYGQVTFVDENYRNFSLNPQLGINTLQPTAVGQIDIHEAQMTDRNTILVTAYNNTQYDLSSLNSSSDFWKSAWVTDVYVYELDVATGAKLFEWKALDHVDQIPLNSSRQPLVTVIGNGTQEAPWDWIHINSIELIQMEGKDYYLVDARHTFSVFLVDAETGRLVWKLDGETGGDFGPLPEDGAFRWQHDARAFNVTPSGMELRLFDNHGAELFPAEGPEGQSKVLIYQLEFPPSKSVSPKLVKRTVHPGEPLYANSMGSYNLLDNGNEIVGWGQVAISSEFGPNGDLRWEGQFGKPGDVLSYRFFKDVWHGTPADWDPNLVVENGKAYVSWNGATDVEEWKVYVGQSKDQLRCVGSAKKKGFETTFQVPMGAKFVQVGAFQHGEEVRKSNVASV